MVRSAMVEQVDRLVGNLLAAGGEVFLPGVGSLYTERRGAKRLSKRTIEPPCRVVGFSSQQRGVSLVELLARVIRDGAQAGEPGAVFAGPSAAVSADEPGTASAGPYVAVSADEPGAGYGGPAGTVAHENGSQQRSETGFPGADLPEAGPSETDFGAGTSDAVQVEAQEIYERWLSRTREGNTLTIEGVGVLKFKHFTPDEAFDRRLNPQGHAPVRIRRRRRFDWALAVGVAAILAAAGFGGYELWMLQPGGNSPKEVAPGPETVSGRSAAAPEDAQLRGTGIADHGTPSAGADFAGTGADPAGSASDRAEAAFEGAGNVADPSGTVTGTPETTVGARVAAGTASDRAGTAGIPAETAASDAAKDAAAAGGAAGHGKSGTSAAQPSTPLTGTAAQPAARPAASQSGTAAQSAGRFAGTAAAQPAGTADAPARLVSGHCYVVLGVYSTPENAARAAREAAEKNGAFRCGIYRFGQKYMVSPFESEDAETCALFIRTHADEFPGMWSYTAR